MRKISSYGERLRYARELAGLTQEQLAKAIGQRPTAISAVEQGLAQRSSRTVQIAQTIGVLPEWLEHGRGPMVRPMSLSDEAQDIARKYESLPAQGKAAVRAVILSFGPAASDERVAQFIPPVRLKR